MLRRSSNVSKLLVVFVSVLFLISCAGVSEKWGTLSDSEKSKIILDGMQEQLDNLFDTGKAYITLHPEQADIWKSKIVPAFSVANKSIAAAIKLCQTENMTPLQAYVSVEPLITEVINLLKSIGVRGGVS